MYKSFEHIFCSLLCFYLGIKAKERYTNTNKRYFDCEDNRMKEKVDRFESILEVGKEKILGQKFKLFDLGRDIVCLIYNKKTTVFY